MSGMKRAFLLRRRQAQEADSQEPPVLGRLAYPVRAEATKHEVPGRKSLSCPGAVCAAVGATWEASKLGGLNIKECLQPRKDPREKLCSRIKAGSRPYAFQGKADDTGEETGKRTPWDRRGMGPSIRGKIRRDNVGKIPWAAGAGRNLQRVLERGSSRRTGEPNGIGARVRRSEDGGATPSEEAEHVSPMKELPTSGKGTLDTWRFHRQRGGRTQSRR